MEFFEGRTALLDGVKDRMMGGGNNWLSFAVLGVARFVPLSSFYVLLKNRSSVSI
jgi:hypothetical protein